MLRLIFLSQPLKYRTAEPPGAPHPFGATYPKNGPYVEKLSNLQGGFIMPTETITNLEKQPEDKAPTVSTTAPMSLIVVGTASVSWWPSYETQAWQWDAKTGKYIGLVPILSNVGGLFIQQLHRSRQGKFYVELILSDGLLEFTFGGAVAGGNQIPASRFGIMAFGAPLGIDDVADRILRASGTTIEVYVISTGKLMFKREMPAYSKAICLEDDDRAYILLENRQLILFDYMRGDVMGSSKVGTGAWGQGDVAMTWDSTVRRVLVYELVPDAPDKSNLSKWKGYRPVPEPVRLTTPIPLKPPRKDRIIPVMTQVVGDSNEPVGGYIVQAVVTGDAAVVGTPTTDGLGTALIKVKCGLDQPVDSSGPSGSGSPPDELTYLTLDAAGQRPDIGYFEGHTYIVYESPAGMHVLRDGMETYLVTDIPGGTFPRVVGKSCIFRDGTQAMFWPDLDQGPATWQILDPQCSGEHPVALNPSFLMWQTGPGYQVKFKNRANAQPGTSGLGNAHGISRVTKNGHVLMDTDASRADMNGNVWGRHAAFSSSLIVCEALSGGGAVLRMNDEPATEIKLWDGEVVLEPRIAVYGKEVSVVCWGGTGLRFAQFSTDELLQYVPGDAAGWGTGTGGSGAGTDPLAPVIGRACWFGYYYQFSQQYGDNPNAPSNVAFVQDAQSITAAVNAGKKLILAGPAVQAAVGHEDDVVALYIEKGHEAELEAAVTSLRASTPATLAMKPVIGLFDGGQRMPSRAMTGMDWLGLECYTGVNETAAQCQARVVAAMNAFGAPYSAFLLVGQSYTSNANNTSNPQVLVDTQYIPANIAKDDGRVSAILMFSDGRPTGTREHENWRPIHRAILEGISGEGTPGGSKPPPGTFHIKVSIKLAVPPPAQTGGPGTGTPPGTGPGGTGLVWAWSDLHTNPNPPDAPGSQPGAPTTLAQWEGYFFSLIARTKGSPADDYVEVLKDLQTRGMKVNPIAGEVPSTSWPFFGMSLMVDGGGAGNPRGRIWLPTADDNDAGYYTYEIQVIGNAPAGGGTTFGPNEMPNMKHVVDAIYAAGPPGGGSWDLQDSNQFAPNGRGVFTGLCVDAMHAEDPRFGHFNKTPPHTRYEGHAVDAVCFINDDGLSQEGADIVRGGTSGDLTQWGAYDRGPRTEDGKYNCWIYPANAANGTGGS